MPDAAPLLIVPRTLEFAAHEFAALADWLDRQAAATEIIDLDDPAEIRLDHQWRWPGGLRLTRAAFRQLGATSCAGLTTTVAELAGLRRAHGDPIDEEADPGLAAAVFNTVVARRFETRLAGRVRVVVDREQGTVDGVLGPGYTLMANRQVLEMAVEAAEDSELAMTPLEAWLTGRHLVLRFAARAVPHAATDRDPGYRVGAEIINGEIGGESSVVVAPLLVRAGHDARAAAGPPARGRRHHAGYRIKRRLNQSLEAVFGRDAGWEVWADRRLAALREQPLGPLQGEDQAVADRKALLAAQLRSRGLASREARLHLDRMTAVPGATVRDLFEALVDFDRPGSAAHAASAARAAYAIAARGLQVPPIGVPSP